jgi:glutaredoxin 2
MLNDIFYCDIDTMKTRIELNAFISLDEILVFILLKNLCISWVSMLWDLNLISYRQLIYF